MRPDLKTFPVSILNASNDLHINPVKSADNDFHAKPIYSEVKRRQHFSATFIIQFRPEQKQGFSDMLLHRIYGDV